MFANNFLLLGLFLLVLSACTGSKGTQIGLSSGSSSSSSSSTSSSSSSTSSSSSSSSSSSFSSSSSSSGVSLIIQENQAGFCGYSGTISTEHSGFTGSGYIESKLEIEWALTWAVYSATGGTYSVTLRYASGIDTGFQRALLKQKDPSYIASTDSESQFNLFHTRYWDNWTNETQSIYLKPGNNILSLYANGGVVVPNIDYISFYGLNHSVGNCPAAAVKSN